MYEFKKFDPVQMVHPVLHCIVASRKTREFVRKSVRSNDIMTRETLARPLSNHPVYCRLFCELCSYTRGQVGVALERLKLSPVAGRRSRWLTVAEHGINAHCPCPLLGLLGSAGGIVTSKTSLRCSSRAREQAV